MVLEDNQQQEKKRKSQEILEAAAFHLILLSNRSLAQYINYNKQSDSDDDEDHGSGGFRWMKKKKLDHGVEDKYATSIASSSINSGISIEEEVRNEERTTRRLKLHRYRSIVDIYEVTRPL